MEEVLLVPFLAAFAMYVRCDRPHLRSGSRPERTVELSQDLLEKQCVIHATFRLCYGVCSLYRYPRPLPLEHLPLPELITYVGRKYEIVVARRWFLMGLIMQALA